MGCAEDAGAAAGRFLGPAGMGRRIGAQEELWVAGCGGSPQGNAVQLPLGHRQAVHVGPQPPLEQGVAVDVQVVGRDRGGQGGGAACHEIGGLGRGDVLEHHLQALMPFQKRFQVPLDEHRFAIKDVDRRVGHFPVDQQGHADPLHGFEDRGDSLDGRHPSGRIGGGVGWVELAGRQHPRVEAPLEFGRIAGIGEVGRDQGRKAWLRRQGLEDPLPIGLGGGHGGHRRAQVWHHDGAAKGFGRARHHGFEHGPIPQVHMPVVGFADR